MSDGIITSLEYLALMDAAAGSVGRAHQARLDELAIGSDQVAARGRARDRRLAMESVIDYLGDRAAQRLHSIGEPEDDILIG